MKNRFYPVCLVLLLPLLNSCSVVHPEDGGKNNSLRFLGKSIEKDTKLVIYLENKSGFNLDGQNLSNDTLGVRGESSGQKWILPKEKFNLKIDSGATIELVNESRKDIKLDLKIFNHNSNIIDRVYKAKG